MPFTLKQRGPYMYPFSLVILLTFEDSHLFRISAHSSNSKEKRAKTLVFATWTVSTEVDTFEPPIVIIVNTHAQSSKPGAS